MGNWMGSWFRRKPRDPSVEDYSAYISDLAEIQEFLDRHFQRGQLEIDPDMMTDGYLEALKLKQAQLQKMRLFVQQRLSREEPSHRVLFDQLDSLEPQCQAAIDELTLALEQREAQTQQEILKASPVDVGMDTYNGADIATVAEPLVDQHFAPDFDFSSQSLTSGPADEHYDQDNAPRGSTRPSSAISAQDTVETDGTCIKHWAAQTRNPSDIQITKWKISIKAVDLLDQIFLKYEQAISFSSKDRTLWRRLEIIFEGEQAVLRENATEHFFRAAFKEAITGKFKDCRMFEGKVGHLLPDINAEHLVYGYKYLGIMIAHSLLNDCRGFSGLSPAIQDYIVHATSTSLIEERILLRMSVHEVADAQLKKLLLKLQHGETLLEADEDLLQTWTEQCGCRAVPHERNNPLFVQTILEYYIFHSRIRQIQAIADGMNVLKLQTFLMQHPSARNKAFVFPSVDEVQVTPDAVMAVVTSKDDDDVNDQTLDFFQLFLHDLYDEKIEDKRLSDLVQFLSGSPYLPAQVALTFNGQLVYPVAHTCFNHVELPTRHQLYADFRDAFLVALRNPSAFNTMSQ